jgi:D-erythronate 2-dehydrogenase
MHILCTGAAGMIGRKLTARLAKDGALGGRAISCLTLTDIAAPDAPAASGDYGVLKALILRIEKGD